MEIQTPSSYPDGDSRLAKKVVLDHEKEGLFNHSEILNSITREMVNSILIKDEEDSAALMMQKAYRGYRTRRQLSDSAVLVEAYWWQAIDHVRLNRSTISFFKVPETTKSTWRRVSDNAARIGKGGAEDEKARKLAFQHWIEAIDPRHRYGHNLHFYHEVWCNGDIVQPFFYWLDIGDGRDVDLEKCPRSKLGKQCVKYLGPQERERYEYIINEGTILHKLSGEPMDTSVGTEGAKWIFVMSTSKRLYAGEKKKGCFHHSSFLAGGTILAAGRLVAENGQLQTISAYSGHYRPTEENLDSFKDFLIENGVNINKVQICSVHGIASLSEALASCPAELRRQAFEFVNSKFSTA